MNRPLPPGDRGHRGGDPSREAGFGGTLPGAVGLVGGTQVSAHPNRMIGHGTKLGHKQEAALSALLSQRNVDEAARVAGIGARTLWRWLQLPEFQAAYRQARRESFLQSVARLQQASSAAVSTLLKVMVDAKAPAASRVRAAAAVLDYAANGIELEDFASRISELERVSEAAKAM